MMAQGISCRLKICGESELRSVLNLFSWEILLLVEKRQNACVRPKNQGDFIESYIGRNSTA